MTTNNVVWTPIEGDINDSMHIRDGKLYFEDELGEAVIEFGRDDVRVCHAVPAPHTSLWGEPLDAPDGPGWWVFEGHVGTLSREYRTVSKVLEHESDLYYLLDGYKMCPVKHLAGKWCKLTMPWDAGVQSE